MMEDCQLTTKSTLTNEVLLIDDMPKNLQLLSDILTRNGYDVRTAISGPLALQYLETHSPDVILLDIKMPVMDGFEVCRRIKANGKNRDIPVIFISALGEVEDKITAFEVGGVDYVTKPFQMEEVLARVDTHLRLVRALKEMEAQKDLIENQNRELIEAAKLREDIDAIIRHDLKAPLQPIINYPQKLLKNKNLTEKEQIRLAFIKQAGYRMLHMINSSLDLFKMERGIYQLKPVPIDILPLINEIEKESNDTRTAKDLSIEIMVSERPVNQEETFTVLGEELLCYTLLANLIKNAIEASPIGERIRIDVEKEESAIISIHNKGAVPQEIRERFFEKYVTYRKSGGTGLGTYSAKLIAEAQHGRISMTTSEDKGTTITIWLPCE